MMEIVTILLTVLYWSMKIALVLVKMMLLGGF